MTERKREKDSFDEDKFKDRIHEIIFIVKILLI